jgi:hypothetical protein
MKIRRNSIEKAVEPQIDAWYAAQGTVLWA